MNPIASCMICGQVRELSVWIDITKTNYEYYGVCIICRSSAQQIYENVGKGLVCPRCCTIFHDEDINAQPNLYWTCPLCHAIQHKECRHLNDDHEIQEACDVSLNEFDDILEWARNLENIPRPDEVERMGLLIKNLQIKLIGFQAKSKILERLLLKSDTGT